MGYLMCRSHHVIIHTSSLEVAEEEKYHIHLSLGFINSPLHTHFFYYTVKCRHSQRTHTPTPMNTHANPILMSIFEDCAHKSLRRDLRSQHKHLTVDRNIAQH